MALGSNREGSSRSATAFSALPGLGRCRPAPGGRPRRRELLALAAPLPTHKGRPTTGFCASGPIPGFRSRPPVTSAVGRNTFSMKTESIPVLPRNAARISAGADTPSSPRRPLFSTGTPPRQLAPGASVTAISGEYQERQRMYCRSGRFASLRVAGSALPHLSEGELIPTTSG